MTLYGHYIKYGPKCSDHIRSTIFCWCTFLPQPVTSPPRFLPFAHTNRPSTQRQMLSGVQLHQLLQNLGVHMFRRLVRPNILFSREYFLRESRGPRIYVFHTPRPSHTRADLLAVFETSLSSTSSRKRNGSVAGI